ncbi:hypothetical protein [Halorubrum sp. SY-15]|jgi:hypothetical protein|uniref:hypothetical protein n=1 Tax=Halorubrum sp. SY-15 TaxID=3402277 RepID=UPI003EBF0C2E
MKRRELLMLVASGGSVFAPSMASGSEHSFDDVVDPDAISPDEADSPMTTPDDSDPDETDPATETDRETVELTIELY